MDGTPRHQCLLYERLPARHLPAIGQRIQEKLAQNYRCYYLNSPVMVADMRSHLRCAGMDVSAQTAQDRLILSYERSHLVGGRSFDVDRMISGLKKALDQALKDGFAGLFATGDMTWEFGPDKGSMKLLEYEWRLEELFHDNPQLEGICQYQLDMLPGVDARDILLTLPGVFVNQTLSLMNPHFVGQPNYSQARTNPQLGEFVGQVLASSAA